MFRFLVGCLLALQLSCFGQEEEWLKQAAMRTDLEAVAWLKQHLKENPITKEWVSSHHTPFLSQKEKCLNCPIEDWGDVEFPQVLVFMSFSVPETVWLSLSKEIEKVGGIFVLRGLPENSFQKLASQILKLKTLGVNVPIQIDPKQFQDYRVELVPTFIVIDERISDKVQGNVSLKFALELMSRKGDTVAAKILYQLMKGQA